MATNNNTNAIVTMVNAIVAGIIAEGNKVVTDILSNIKAGTIVRLTTLTTPKMNKRNNPYYNRVQKLCVQTAQYGYSYENGVNNRIGDDVTFVSQPLAWGEWLVPNKVIINGNDLYVRFYTTENANMSVLYLVDGRVATSEETKEILSFIPQRKASNTQNAVGLTKHQVQPMSIKSTNIVRVVGGGVTIDNPKVDAERYINLAKMER